MVQESRSLLIQQLFQGGFKEDDDDEDEDETVEQIFHHPSGDSDDKYQGFENKKYSQQKLMYDDWEGRYCNSKGSKEYATEDQYFDNNGLGENKLLSNTKLQKDPKTELQSVEKDCLQSEKEIIEEGRIKLLQIHNKFLNDQHNSPLQSIEEPTQYKLETSKDNNCFSNDCDKLQLLKERETLNPSLNLLLSKLTTNNKENNVHVVERETQQSYGFVEDDFTSLVSLETKECKDPSLTILNNAEVSSKDLNSNISIGLEKKSSISECIESLANDQGSKTDLENGGNGVIQDIMLVEKTIKIDKQKRDLFTTRKKKTTEATTYLSRVEEVVQDIERIVPVIQMETTQIEKKCGSNTTNKIKDCRIETIAKSRQAKDGMPFSHVFEDTRVEILSNVQETKIEFNNFDVKHQNVNDKISMVLNSPIVVEENLSVMISKAKLEDHKTTLGKKDRSLIPQHYIVLMSYIHGIAESINIINVEKTTQMGEVNTFKCNKETMDFQGKFTCDMEETQLTEMNLKQCANATLHEEATKKNYPIVIADNKNDVADCDIICSLGKEKKSVMFTSSGETLLSLVEETNKSPLNEIPTNMDSLVEKMPTLQAIKGDLTLDIPKVHTTSTTTSPQVVEIPTMLVPPHTIATSENKRSKPLKKAGTSKMSKKKKRICKHHQDARTMVFMRSDTRVAYNNDSHFATNTDHSLPLEISQHCKNTNNTKPSLYGLVGSPQAVQVEPLMSHETNFHLMQAQISAKDAMVAATSALAQSHCEWSHIQTHTATLHRAIKQETQIAAIAASVAAAAVVAKAAIEAAKAIQEASREFFGQVGCSSQLNLGKNRFSKSTEMIVHGQANISEMKNCQHMQFPNPSKIKMAQKIRNNQKFKSLSASSTDKLVSSRSKEKMIRFMKQEMVTNDKKVMGEKNCKKRTINEMEQIHEDFPSSSHTKLTDLGCEALRCTIGISTEVEPNELVEVMTGEVGHQGGWFVAKVLMKTDTEVFVEYNELFRADGCTPYRNLFPLSSFRQEDAYGRIEQGDWRWLRPLHPFNKVWKLCSNSIYPQTWTIGNHIDTYSNGGWWEGIVVDIDKTDETNVKVHFSGGKGIHIVKTWNIRPSLIWVGDHWRPWKENSPTEVHNEPFLKRLKPNVVENWKTRSEKPIAKEKMHSSKTLEEDTSCKSISNPLDRPRVTRHSIEVAAQKNQSGNMKSNAPNTQNVDFTPKKVGYKCKQASDSIRRVHLTSWSNLAPSKKLASPTLLGANKGVVSTRLQVKSKGGKCQKIPNMVVQKGTKSVSTRSDTLKLKSKTIQTKLLNALKNTSNSKSTKFPHPIQKVNAKR